MRCCLLIALAMLLIGPAAAAVSPGIALDNIDSTYNYWPDKQHRAFEWRTAAGHEYRAYKPQVTSTVAGGLLVIVSMDHIIANGVDDHAELALTFDAAGVLSTLQTTFKLAKNNAFTVAASAADLVSGAALPVPGPYGVAVAVAAKVASIAGKTIGGLVNKNGGTDLLPAEVQLTVERIAKPVLAAASGAKVQHEGDPIQFWRGNSCGEAQAGTADGSPLNVKLPWKGVANDNMRSLRVYNNISPGTSIQLFDDGSGSKSKDDWAEITVADPSRFAGVGECISTLERDRGDAAIQVTYHKKKGSGNLDGKVSHVTVAPPR